MLIPPPCFQRHQTSQPCFFDNCRHPCYCSRAPSVCLATSTGKLGRGMFAGVIGKVGTAATRTAKRWLIPSDDSGIEGQSHSTLEMCFRLSALEIDENRDSAAVYEIAREMTTGPLIQDASPRTQVPPQHPKRSASTATFFHHVSRNLALARLPSARPHTLKH